jgi:hypothetical protein
VVESLGRNGVDELFSGAVHGLSLSAGFRLAS